MTKQELERWMQVALRAATRAAKAEEVPVGAVVVFPDGAHFVAENRTRRDRDPTAHAEILAIRAACRARANERIEDATLFVTVEPCPMCAGAIAWARIARVVYGAPEPKTGAVESRFALLGNRALWHRPKILAGVLEDEARALLQEFFVDKRGR